MNLELITKDTVVGTKVYGKYIYFAYVVLLATGQHWAVRNTRDGGILGYISYYPGWKQYVLRPEGFTEFNASCLEEIVAVLKRLNEVAK